MSGSSFARHDGALGSFSQRDFLTIVFKRRALITIFVVTVVILVMTLSLMAPNTYEVSATLLVNEARAEMPIAPSASQPLVVNQVSEQDLNSEIEILKSRQLIEDVLQTLGMGEPTAPEKSTGGGFSGTLRGILGLQKLSDFDELVVHLQRAIDFSPVRKSNVIKITFESKDPDWATQVVGTLTDLYLEQRVERYQSPQAVVFFEQQMRETQERLIESESKLERYVDEASITMVEGSDGSDSLAAQKELVMNRLAGLESSLDSAEVEVESQRRQVASLQGMLRNEPERLESSSRMNLDASTEEIERALTALRLKRDSLLQDFRPDSRHVRDIDTQIRMAEDRLQQATGTSSVSGTEANPLYVQLRMDLLRAEAALEGSRSRVSSLRTQAVEYRKELDSLNAKSFDLENLNRDAQAAEDDYLLYRRKHEEARISAAMDQEKFINVTVAQPAQIPLEPESRGLGLKFFMALLVGVLGGVGLAFGLENSFDRSFTTGEDIERKLGIPHIASIPEGEMVG
jgi:succinoglycan biosynthesis transport protein ExoP